MENTEHFFFSFFSWLYLYRDEGHPQFFCDQKPQLNKISNNMFPNELIKVPIDRWERVVSDECCDI